MSHLSPMYIADDEAPNIKCMDDLSVQTYEGKPTAVVTLGDPSASDNSGKVSITCDAESEAELTIGKTLVTCEAVDNGGNKADCSFQVTVAGRFVSYVKCMWYKRLYINCNFLLVTLSPV